MQYNDNKCPVSLVVSEFRRGLAEIQERFSDMEVAAVRLNENTIYINLPNIVYQDCIEDKSAQIYFRRGDSYHGLTVVEITANLGNLVSDNLTEAVSAEAVYYQEFMQPILDRVNDIMKSGNYRTYSKTAPTR